MSILIQSSIMIFLLTSIIFFLMSKLVNITKFNIIIYVVLIGFWIASSFLKISIIHVGHPWQWPLIIATYQFTQVIFRLPLGKLSQKLKSRKIPLLLTVFIMVIFSIPLMITINTLTIFLAMFGLGFFGAGFGMQNQYWSENWHIKNVFITVGLIGITPYLGDYIGSIVKETVEINQNTIKYILMIFIIIIMLIVILYSTNKEKKETVMLDNKDKIASIINGFGLKNVLYMSIMISIISISISLVNNPFLVHKENLNDTLLIAISSKTASITISLFVTFFMIRFISVRKINLISHIIMIIGLLILLIGNFGIKSYSISMIGFIFATIGASMYTTTMMGVMLHFDHKNTLLVLGIWLTIKSASLATGTVITGEIYNYRPEHLKYLIIVSILLVISSMFVSLLIYHKYSKPVYETAQFIEHRKNHKAMFKGFK